MYRRIIIVITATLIACTAAFAERNPFVIPQSAFSASYSSGSFSSMINPAFTQSESNPFLAYSYMKPDEAKDGNHFVMLNFLDLDLIYSWYDTLYNYETEQTLHSGTSLYTINKGFMFNNVFGFGIGYSFSQSDVKEFDNYGGWSAGFVFRPAWFISFSAVAKDFYATSRNDSITHTEIYSLSLRPVKDYLTLSVDATKYSQDITDHYIYTFGCELAGWKDITLTAKGDTDRNFTFGLSMPFFSRNKTPHTTTISGYASNNKKSPDAWSGGISFSASRDIYAPDTTALNNYLYLQIKGDYNDEQSPSRLFASDKTSFYHLLRGLRRAAEDNTIDALILDIDNSSFGFAQMQEIRSELEIFRGKGKKVYALMSYTGNREYYLATAADEIYFTPNSTFAITGLSMQVYFFKGLMDKAGVKFESVSRGKYKSFNEPFTRENMSKYARENMEEVLSDLNEQYIDGIMKGRNLSREDINSAFDAGFYTPEAAKEKGFIDEVANRDDALISFSEKASIVKFENYIEESDIMREWGPIPAIAIVYVKGSIVSGKGKDSRVSSSTGDYDYRDSLTRAFTDPIVQAVVIRVDSGGGSASASDYMWNYLLLMKKKYPKPVVFSFGNTAASGGYYISCTGDKIYSSRGTITGSIGVISGKISMKELYGKLGINKETIKLSEFADAFSESRDLTDREKELFQKGVDFIYDRFTGRVVEGRKISKDTIPVIAEGKVHTGTSALQNHLTDETGGLMAAIEYARSLSIKGDNYTIIRLPDRHGVLSEVFQSSDLLSPFGDLEVLFRSAEKYAQFDKEHFLYLNPYIIEIK